jgi:adenylate kinase family enzyme
MIYLIGGAPRVGKTTLSKMILERKHIPFISTDLLRDALHEAYPELHIKDGKWKDWSKNFNAFFVSLVKHAHEIFPDCVIEGDVFFPSQVASLNNKNVICCYLGTSKTDLETLKGVNVYDDWVTELTPKEQATLPELIVSISNDFKKEAEKYRIPYFDMANNRENQLEKAYKALFDGKVEVISEGKYLEFN